MNFKKIAFSCISLPLGFKTYWAYKWQKERKVEKKREIEQRIAKLTQPLIDVKPKDL